MGFLPPGYSQGVVEGLDGFQQRAEREQLMRYRQQMMEQQDYAHQQQVAQQNRDLENARSGGIATAAKYGGGQYGFLSNPPQSQTPQPGQGSVPMQQASQPQVGLPPGQTSADYPNWQPSMAPKSIQEGVIPFNQPMQLTADAPIGKGQQGMFRTADPDYEGLNKPLGVMELGTVNAEPKQPPQPLVIPPYKTIDRTPTPEPQVEQRPLVPPQVNAPPLPQGVAGLPQAPSGGFPIEEAVQLLLAKGVKPENLLGPLKAMESVLNRAAKEELAQVMAEFKQAQAENNAMRRKIDQQKADIRGRDVDSLIDTREARLPMEQQRADAATAQAAASGKRASYVGQATPGNINTALTRMSREMGPIDEAQRQTSEIRGLIATANAASTPQIQRILSNYMNAGRTTNQLFVSNANFGNMYERGANALSRLTQGDYSDANKQQVLDMVNQMDSSVFAPARAKLNSKYRMQAEHMRINPDVFDNQNIFGESKAPPSAAKPKTSTESLRQWAGSPKGSVDMGNGWSVTERK